MPQSEAKEYEHPSILNGKKVFGKKLFKDDILEENDLYPSCNGEWNVIGEKLKGQAIIKNPSVSFFFVRPKK